MENGNKFTIEAEGNDMGHVYIADATLNGHKLDKNYITYGDLARGGKLTFTMSDTPVKTRGI